jgi:hypothetical protein
LWGKAAIAVRGIMRVAIADSITVLKRLQFIGQQGEVKRARAKI